MQKKDNKIYYSASDLTGFIQCHHLTTLEKKRLAGELKRPERKNTLLETLQQRGEEFEIAVLEELKLQGKRIVSIDKKDTDAYQSTINAMKSGAEVIYQGKIEMDVWQGWADFLIRTEVPSNLGDWSYEVYDTKLATHTKAATILQLSLYTEAIAAIQGTLPEYMYVRQPKGTECYRVDGYSAYYRLVKKQFLDAVANEKDTYPDMVAHCDSCAWWKICNKVRRSDDHLQFIAGLGNAQLRELRRQGINKLETMAQQPSPLPFRPKTGSIYTYEKLREQARLQLKVRTTGKPQYELLPRVEEQGLFKLPEPNECDIFLDLEGDPMVGSSGREYIFGYMIDGKYTGVWAEMEEEEKSQFEYFMTLVKLQLFKEPKLHIYHYGAYETSAFKRLAGKYGVMTEELDSCLRSKTFVNLHQIVRQTLRAGVEKYSLKDLEIYFGYKRKADLQELSPIKAEYEMLLETDRTNLATDEMRAMILTYNEDDCRAAHGLYQWLCIIRTELRNNGEDIPPPEKPSGAPSKELTQHQELVRPIYEGLLKDIPADYTIHTTEQRVRYLLAHLLDWYGREDKKTFWDKYRLQEADEEELLDDQAAIYGMVYTNERSIEKKHVIDTYSYPEQVCDLRSEDQLLIHGTNVELSIDSIDRKNRKVKIKKTEKCMDIHPLCVFRFKHINKIACIARLVQLASEVLENGIDIPQLNCGLDLLKRNQPKIISPVALDKTSYDGRVEWLMKLDNSTLPIQGPPGTGKTYNASRFIIELVKAGKKIGVTALSHKVITNLLYGIYEEAHRQDFTINIIQKPEKNSKVAVPWKCSDAYDTLAKAASKMHVIAGTSMFWAHHDMANTVDYLFVDEAGQLSLADTLACIFATKNLVLLGDPQQLKQPQQGVHPEGVDVSALEHLFCGQQTITTDQGIFLETTWRMHPKICAFNSKLFYDNKLQSFAGLERQQITGNTKFNGSGLYFESVPHSANNNHSPEEVEAVAAIFAELTKGDVFWENAKGVREVVTAKHIKIITPYNSQLHEIKMRLNGFEEVGTVDKFQGQEAPIVICSMATSTAEEAPRGMEFLYSPNRFNVAVSRARAAFILVASPTLFEPECKTVKDMNLANVFCEFMEMAN